MNKRQINAALRKMQGSSTLSLLEKGEIFLEAKEFHGMHVDEIVEKSGCEQATVYNGIKLAHLPNKLKKYITSDKIPATTVLSLTRGLKKSPSYHSELEGRIKEKIAIIQKRKKTGEYGKRITLYDKLDQLKELLEGKTGRKAKALAKSLLLIENHENMEEVIDQMV